mgnify:CR=1 FL=1
MNVPLPDLGDDRRLLCPLCFEAVEEASVEYREVQREASVPTVSETPEISGAMTFETVEAVVLSPCGHATHRAGGDRPDLFLPWTYEDPGMSERFEELRDYLNDLEQEFSRFDIGLYGQVGPLHDSQVAERRREERIYVRFAYEEWTVPEISDLPYEQNPVQIPKLLDYSPVEDWTSSPWSGLDPGTTVRTVHYVREVEE